MRAVDIIAKKRDGLELSTAEIEFFVRGYAEGHIPDYQAAAWCMAVLLRGMSARETTDLTLAMARSGKVLDLRAVAEWVLDKHSTGGVGDKTTLVVAPLVASAGVPVGKMSGRGLGFSGGTIDKLESIPGYRVALSHAQFIRQLREHGIVVAAQSADLAPADGKFYALRDVTATVESIPLIASSIMSKKIAAGATGIVLDVKVGRGAFMKTLEMARELAQLMIAIGQAAGRRVAAVLADMNQPLGQAVGNALEVHEAIRVLRGEGPADVRDHCLTVGALMLALAGHVANLEAGRALLARQLESGAAWHTFVTWITAQGGAATVLEHPERLPQAALIEPLPAPRAGYLAAIDAQVIGQASVVLGAGREKKDDPIDHAVGIVLHKKIGDAVERGEALLTLYANHADRLAAARELLRDAWQWSDSPPSPPPHLYEIIPAELAT
ncbi:MAG: pyrimidine-nucleoside phosphorylase [Anaerolineae bacterium]|nr:pyrimidine-nucleoside phosphorylase [Anaerolineae bacterium]MDW8070789.1 pyrimidine-nucleoside phosphorylase [Anaerolineae bacterium]